MRGDPIWGKVKASHIADATVFVALDKSRYFGKYGNHTEVRDRNICIWDVQFHLPQFPPKVVRAKLMSMEKRGLLTGCWCGCRADIEILKYA